MKVYNGIISFKTSKGIGFTNLTDKVIELAKNAQVENGMLFLFAPHATGAIIINEYESRLLEDIRKFLEELVPSNGRYRHSENATSHILSSFLKPSTSIPIVRGVLQLGTWQSIIWVEVEPWPRTRMVSITIIGE